MKTLDKIALGEKFRIIRARKNDEKAAKKIEFLLGLGNVFEITAKYRFGGLMILKAGECKTGIDYKLAKKIYVQEYKEK